MPSSLGVRNGRIIDPSQNLDQYADLLIVDGRIEAIGNNVWGEAQLACIFDAQGMIVAPGFVDLHCHLRDPGFLHKETIATGTRAAAKGGFTSVCCMPNTNPPVDNINTLQYVKDTVSKESMIRVFPIGSITVGQMGEVLTDFETLAKSGVVGFSDDGKSIASDLVMRRALELAGSINMPVIDHCEDIRLSQNGVINDGPVARQLGVPGIPVEAEESVVARDIELAKSTGAWLHIAHISTTKSLQLVRDAKKSGCSVTAEVTPHHLVLTEDSVLSRGSLAKVNPPLRTSEDTEALIEGLIDGTIDAIATDHAPHSIDDKQCSLVDAAFGISGFETALGCLMPLTYDDRFDMVTLISKLATEPAQIIQRGQSKAPFLVGAVVPRGLGTLRVGALADVTVFDPDMEWRVSTSTMLSKGPCTPWEGCLLRGGVIVTFVGGQLAYQDVRYKTRYISNG
ncbi:MAG: dihydroorotase [Chloroflexota bacterium]|nr:dihydroorotase [Chloroflexota bacterium]